ncbi:MAG: RNA 2'-phosphotransferase [Deltaproteobacteria bacterium]|nr:RNA 2'-phosphotransferase [Deltaproteobacteria bacterium]
MSFNKYEFVKLSKAVSHALRHEPWLYELELDEQGWVLIKDLLTALRSHQLEWNNLNQDDIAQMIVTSSKKRHEINGNHIRALYGHSVPGKLLKKKAEPPEQLYHGTSSSILNRIMESGLLPMGRQFVHLSVNIDIAEQVGRRKDEQPAILLIAAKEAYAKGINFYVGNDTVWLADNIPAEFISRSRMGAGLVK